nr:hypothetical protein [Bradyrhizobium sp. 190]
MAEKARQDWAESFVRAAEAAKLQAVAVSDHHDVCLSKYAIEAAQRLSSSLRVFPAVEVTCADNAQCLAIFDPSLETDRQKLILAAAGNILMAPESDAKTCTIAPARETVIGFVDNILAEQHLKDSCVILPHFSKQDAHKSLNEVGHHPRFANLLVDGVYIERPYEELDPVTLDKIQGKIDDWGRRRRAVLATGDNRAADWNRLGKHDCWIKLGEHSVEALRQALLADEARIAYSLDCRASRAPIVRGYSSVWTRGIRYYVAEGTLRLDEVGKLHNVVDRISEGKSSGRCARSFGASDLVDRR